MAASRRARASAAPCRGCHCRALAVLCEPANHATQSASRGESTRRADLSSGQAGQQTVPACRCRVAADAALPRARAAPRSGSGSSAQHPLHPWLPSLRPAGAVLGALLASWLSCAFGRRTAMWVGTWAFLTGVVLQVLSWHIAQLGVSHAVVGVGMGVMEQAAVLEAIEVAQPQQLCASFLAAQGSAKFEAATEWRQAHPASYECAGIEAACLNGDITRDGPGSSCRALAEATPCKGTAQSCRQGMCGGRPSKDSMPPSKATANSAPAAPPPAAAAGQVAPATPTAVADKAAASRKPDAAEEEEEEEEEQQADDSNAPVPTPAPVPTADNSTWPTAVASVWPGNAGVRVPDTFLATSHEWKRIKDYGGTNTEAWARIFNMMAPSPILRIGGASQDAMTEEELPGDDVWGALRKLRNAANTRYLIGLPLWQKNAVAMSKKIMAAAIANLGPSLIGFELGNEPEFWPTGLGGYAADGTWQQGFEAYAAYFHRVALQLNPCADGRPLLSGPGWGNVNTQDPKWLAEIATRGKGCYLKEVNVHYYPYISNDTVTASELLSQWLQDEGLDKFREYVRIARGVGLGGIRVSETNSLYGGGRKGLSDTLAGGLWVADALFAFANAGARGFHLHWGKGGTPSGDSQPNTGVQTNFDMKVPPGQPPLPWPSVHAPWFGYLFWVTATSSGYGQRTDATFVAASVDKWDACTANIKLWALRSDGGEVRVALLNKDEARGCNMELHMEPRFCSSRATLGRLLPGPLGMASKTGITWQGQHYVGATTTGKLQGTRDMSKAPLRQFAGGKCGYVVTLPPASAALLIVQPPDPVML